MTFVKISPIFSDQNVVSGRPQCKAYVVEIIFELNVWLHLNVTLNTSIFVMWMSVTHSANHEVI